MRQLSLISIQQNKLHATDLGANAFSAVQTKPSIFTAGQTQEPQRPMVHLHTRCQLLQRVLHSQLQGTCLPNQPQVINSVPSPSLTKPWPTLPSNTSTSLEAAKLPTYTMKHVSRNTSAANSTYLAAAHYHSCLSSTTSPYNGQDRFLTAGASTEVHMAMLPCGTQCNQASQRTDHHKQVFSMPGTN